VRYTENELLPISGLQHLIFCERQAALIHLERQWADDSRTVDGEFRHKTVHETAPRRERRGTTIVVRGLLLQSMELGIAGIADVVEFHKSTCSGIGSPTTKLPGAKGFWSPFPVEYKRGRPKAHSADEVQLCAQAFCIEEMLDVEVPEGALFYGKEQRRVSVEFDEGLRKKTIKAAERFHEIIKSGNTPPATKSKKCNLCSLKGLCMPGVVARRRSAKRYLSASLHDILDCTENKV